jgi:hypothetical protein
MNDFGAASPFFLPFLFSLRINKIPDTFSTAFFLGQIPRRAHRQISISTHKNSAICAADFSFTFKW